ncbi:MAG: hypothetical protein R8N23_13280 [Reichenbachiella sp.]|uniref:hypothetical protein n=1 Tax=Reichenbachiella sp. TaxID=2184521 RepID=UPI00296630E5|nr:hypothetical protein [Reichenbachiella sp.]MDW3210842.1 hypothetical protein [Reichenbachiella sp.]
MKKATFTLLTIVLVLQSFMVCAQTENYKKGLEAMQSNRYHEAMVRFTKVVEDEKFEISGKELSQAYAYLAVIRTAYLEKDLQNIQFNNIIAKQGQIQQTIQEMVRAVKFQDSNTKSMVDDSKQTLVEISSRALKVIGDSLMTYDENQANETTDFLARFAIQQFGELEGIAVDNWELHDILGLAHFFIGEDVNAMSEFKKGREQFSKLTEQPRSTLHLKNFIISANYYFSVENNKKETQNVCKQGSSYTSVLINSLNDNEMNEILRLNKIENRFRSYMTRINDSNN